MPTVISFTADRLLALEASTVVSGYLNASGNLILVQHDGDEIDAGSIPSASEINRGLVELATNAEAIAGTDVQRAVPPSALSAALAAKEASTFLDPTLYSDSSATSTYPMGESFVSFTTTQGTAANWGFGTGKAGTVRTYLRPGNSASQIFNRTHASGTTPEMWYRGGDSTGWGAWQQVSNITTLTAGGFAQSTALSSYPQGTSRLYYTTATSSSWDFAGKAGEVTTYRYGDDFGKQTWTKHQGGLSGDTESWIRTANSANGWSRWKALSTDKVDVPWTSITYASGFSAGTARQLQYCVRNGVVYWRGGATGTFPEGTYVIVANIGIIPSAYRSAIDLRGGAVGTGMRPCGWELNTDGAIRMGWQALATAPSWIAFSCSYPLDT